jgi:hypothetical protein
MSRSSAAPTATNPVVQARDANGNFVALHPNSIAAIRSALTLSNPAGNAQNGQMTPVSSSRRRYPLR